MVAEPEATPVTVTAALLAPAAKLTDAGTLAIPVLLELKAAVTPPAGAGADRTRVRLPAEPELMVRLAGEKEMAPAASTCTCPVPEV